MEHVRREGLVAERNVLLPRGNRLQGRVRCWRIAGDSILGSTLQVRGERV